MRKRLYSRVNDRKHGDDDNKEDEELEEYEVEEEGGEGGVEARVVQEMEIKDGEEQENKEECYLESNNNNLVLQYDNPYSEITEIKNDTNHNYNEFQGYFDTQAQEFVTIPERLPSHIDFLWFSTYDSSL